MGIGNPSGHHIREKEAKDLKHEACENFHPK